jgi:hypothetical protein
MKCILPHRLGQTASSPGDIPTLSEQSARSLLLVLAVAVAAGAAAHGAGRARQDARLLTTGGARWIWWTNDLGEPRPVRFRAFKSFSLPSAPAASRARVFADGTWTLWINEEKVGSGEQKPGDRLRTVEASGHLRAGENRLVLEVESATGAGGILFALDADGRNNLLVSDATWRVARSEEEARAGGRPAIVWGRPPMHPWKYP